MSVAGRRASRARPAFARSQHFLRSRALAAELVAHACVDGDDLVVDLGAGTGRLTAELAQVVRRVIAVELEPALAEGLSGRWSNVDVVHGDAMEMALPRETFSVVANVPFHQTTAILHRLLDDPSTPLKRADLVVEWAVAHKYAVPWPSRLNGVLWGATYEASVTRRLSRQAFLPPPSVDAGVLVWRRRSIPLVPAELLGAYHRFVARGFRHGIRSVASRPDLERIGYDAMIARDLDAHQWATLFLRTQAQPSTRRRAVW